MQVLVTGGAGFIGSNLVHALVASGHEAGVIDDLSTGRSTNAASRRVVPHARHPRRRARRRRRRLRARRGRAPRGAGVGRRVGARPGRTHAVNVDGTRAVARAARACGARVVSASSAAVYGEPASVPLPETAPEGADEPVRRLEAVRGARADRGARRQRRRLRELPVQQRVRAPPGRTGRGRRRRVFTSAMTAGRGADDRRRRHPDARLRLRRRRRRRARRRGHDARPARRRGARRSRLQHLDRRGGLGARPRGPRPALSRFAGEPVPRAARAGRRGAQRARPDQGVQGLRLAGARAAGHGSGDDGRVVRGSAVEQPQALAALYAAKAAAGAGGSRRAGAASPASAAPARRTPASCW